MTGQRPSGAARLFRKIKESAANDIYTNLDQAVRGIGSQISSAAEGSRPKSAWAK
jgi:hypothetical protein